MAANISGFSYRSDEYYKSKDPKVRSPKKTFSEFKAVVIGSEIPLYLASLGTLARAINALLLPVFQALIKFSRYVTSTQITSAFTMPFDLHQTLMAFYYLLTTNDLEGRANAALDFFANISQLGDGVSTFTSMIASLTDKAIIWAGPLGLASSLLSSIFIAINSRGIHFNRLSLKALKEVKKESTSIYEFLDSHSIRLQRYAGINPSWIYRKLNNRKIDKLNEAQAKAIYKVLKNRIKQKQISYSLGITITIIGIVATITLFATTMTLFGIAGNSLLAALAILAISKLIYDRYKTKTFKQDLLTAIKPIKTE